MNDLINFILSIKCNHINKIFFLEMAIMSELYIF